MIVVQNTDFAIIYARFLGKITDDQYLEMTPEDTVKDLRRLLIEAIPNFEFPRKNLYDYEINQEEKLENEVLSSDFIIGVNWMELSEDAEVVLPEQTVIIEKSYFKNSLTEEEINILALLMKVGWLDRQIASVEHTRMKYTGSDFKMTSQANHLSKLLTLLEECQRQAFHMQRLYRRRKIEDESGEYRSNWSVLRSKSALSQ